jgi:sugar porter (SP) family MFS transporter
MPQRAGITRTVSGYRSLRETPSRNAVPEDYLTCIPKRSSITPYLIFVIFLVTLGPFQFGFHLGELNAPQSVITCKTKSLPTSSSSNSTFSPFPECIPMSASQWGLVQSIFTLGGLAGSLSAGPISTIYGRYLATMALTVALAVGSLVEAAGFSILSIAAGRFLSGVGAGAATVVCPIYIGELSPPTQRGLFGAFCQVMINAGILVAQVLGYFLSRRGAWRLILAFPGLVSVCTLAAMLLAPETPAWLADNGNMRQARLTLRQIRGPEADIKHEMEFWALDGEDEEQSLLTAPKQSASEKTVNISFIDVVKTHRYRRAVLAVAVVFMAQQLTGINSVVMYSVSILGVIIPSAAALISVMVSAINLLVSLVCTPLPDKIGRKSCLLISIIGMGSCSALLAIGLSQNAPGLTVAALFTFVASFGVGLGPIPFIIMGEVVGPEAVGALSSWALAGNWMSTFSVAQFFPMLSRALPEGKVFWIFTVISLTFGMFIWWKVPETKGKSTPEEVWDI